MINFHELYNKYAKDIYRFVFWLAGNSQDAEDITSETFMRAWMSKSTIKTETVKAYLFTIARNLYLQNIRNKKQYVEVDENIHDINPGPSKITEVNSELQVVLKSMQKLPELDRTILIMHAKHQMSYSEIAASTGLSISAVKVKVHRARLKIETYLRGDKNERNA